MSAAISIADVCKTYQSGWRRHTQRALDGISLTVAAGETFGFIGPNGAGKSTLIKILIGAIRESSGHASLYGCDVHDYRARRGLGFVPENPSLQDYLTPFEILHMGLHLHGTRVANERKYCLDWLARFDLVPFADKPVRGFSKGMLQRTALAHAMAIKPRLLILDEPLSGLDPLGRRDVVEILSDFRAQGGTTFLTSHVLHDVERLADRFGLIHKGELRAVRAPVELIGENDRVVVRCQGGSAALPGMSAEPAGRWSMETPRASLWQTLHDIEAAGHVLVEIRPTLSLEAAFLQVVKGD